MSGVHCKSWVRRVEEREKLTETNVSEVSEKSYNLEKIRVVLFSRLSEMPLL